MGKEGLCAVLMVDPGLLGAWRRTRGEMKESRNVKLLQSVRKSASAASSIARSSCLRFRGQPSRARCTTFANWFPSLRPAVLILLALVPRSAVPQVVKDEPCCRSTAPNQRVPLQKLIDEVQYQLRTTATITTPRIPRRPSFTLPR